MKNFNILLIGILLLSINSVSADDSGFCSIELSCVGNASNIQLLNETVVNESAICIYFFYGLNCPHCARIEPFMNELSGKYPQIDVKPFEIYYSKENQDLFNDFIRRYDIKTVGVPAVFIGDRAFIGERAIRENLENSIEYFIKNKPICPLTVNKIEANPREISPSTKIELTIPTLVIAALVDSINPCAFSVLIFLLIYLLALGARKRILKVGLTYISVVFVVYFLSGLGLFTLIQTTNLTRIVFNLAAILAIIAGIINIKDFFWYGKGIILSIPESKKLVIERYIHKASIPAAAILGFLVSMFELPCTGGVYLAILGLLADRMTRLEAIPYLIIYNIIFVLPLFLILALVYLGISPEKVEDWRLEKRGLMRLIMGIFMILLGLVMLLEVI